MKHVKHFAWALAASVATIGSAALAQGNDLVKVGGAWVRASVPGQKATGAFMKLTSKQGNRLVGASSPVAGASELHEMKMEGNVMKMRAVAGIDLPAGQPVELKPGGYHLMLMDLKSALAKDTTIPVILFFKDVRGVESKIEIKLPVTMSNPEPAQDHQHEHKH